MSRGLVVFHGRNSNISVVSDDILSNFTKFTDRTCDRSYVQFHRFPDKRGIFHFRLSMTRFRREKTYYLRAFTGHFAPFLFLFIFPSFSSFLSVFPPFPLHFQTAAGSRSSQQTPRYEVRLDKILKISVILSKSC